MNEVSLSCKREADLSVIRFRHANGLQESFLVPHAVANGEQFCRSFFSRRTACANPVDEGVV